jgi:hypothetical protein
MAVVLEGMRLEMHKGPSLVLRPGPNGGRDTLNWL